MQVAQDEAAADQQLLSAGVNDRNVEEFLGLIEQRIDDLIQVRSLFHVLQAEHLVPSRSFTYMFPLYHATRLQMSKAAQNQSIRREDFLHIQPADPKAAFHAPHLPSLHETQDDEADEQPEEGAKLQPINIQLLKELMAKKVGRLPQPGKGGVNKHAQLGVSGSVTGMRSRQSSVRSIQSNGSHSSNKSK